MTKPKRYVLMPESIFEDERLDPRALGVLAYIFSQPDHWTVDADMVAQRFNADPYEMTLLICDLEDMGYLREAIAND